MSAQSDDHPAAMPPEILLKECRLTRTRRSGPGGQHRNKVETAVVLEHVPTGHRAEAAESRSPERNQTTALRRLRLTLAVRERRARLSGPSELWQRRCPAGRIVVSELHDDFPALLAEALDVLTSHAGDARAAASHLNCSTSQLVRLVRRHPPAFQTLNQLRLEVGLKELK